MQAEIRHFKTPFHMDISNFQVIILNPALVPGMVAGEKQAKAQEAAAIKALETIRQVKNQ